MSDNTKNGTHIREGHKTQEKDKPNKIEDTHLGFLEEYEPDMGRSDNPCSREWKQFQKARIPSSQLDFSKCVMTLHDCMKKHPDYFEGI